MFQWRHKGKNVFSYSGFGLICSCDMETFTRKQIPNLHDVMFDYWDDSMFLYIITWDVLNCGAVISHFSLTAETKQTANLPVLYFFEDLFRGICQYLIYILMYWFVNLKKHGKVIFLAFLCIIYFTYIFHKYTNYIIQKLLQDTQNSLWRNVGNLYVNTIKPKVETFLYPLLKVGHCKYRLLCPFYT